jgi:ribose transport system substrate-binding protein
MQVQGLSSNPTDFIMCMFRSLITLLVGFALFGCGQSDGPRINTPPTVVASAPGPAPRKEIGLVMKTLTNPFFVEMEKGARRAEKELGVTLTVKTAAQETSIEQQIQLVEDLIAAKANAIVIAPGDSQRLVPALKKAFDAGIKIVNIDNRLDVEVVKQAGLPPIPFVSVDNEAGAYKAGQFLAEGIKVPTEAAVLEGIRSADNAQQRLRGARRALLENKSIKLVASETANWKIDEAYEVTQRMFDKHPHIKLLFASNDMMAIGAIKYLQASRRSGVMVAGFDALEEAIVEIKAARMVATIDQQAAEQGYQGIALAVRLTQGSTVPTVTTINTRLITANSAP